MQNLTNRQKLILKAVTETYNETGLPVSSEEISKLPYLEFSSATIRFASIEDYDLDREIY